MSFRRIPKEIDPRRPPKRRGEDGDDDGGESKARSYGQYVEMTPDEVAELEDATGEVAREGASAAEDAGQSAARSAKRAVQDREAFEETTDEVSREDEESSRR